MGLLRQMLSPDFMPHGYCYLWNPWMVWLHVISDGLITLSYYCIPIALVYFVRKRRDLPFHWIFGMFGAFVLGCGTTHLMEVWTVWHGSYLLSGIVKAITASISVATAVMLVPLVPKAIALPSPVQLQKLNLELAGQIVERRLAEEGLLHLKQQLETRVTERTTQLEDTDKALRTTEQMLRLLLDNVKDYAVYMLDPQGRVASWNAGAERIKGYTAEEVLGKPISLFYTAEGNAAEMPQRALREAVLTGRSEARGLRVRKDGSTFWAQAVVTPIFGKNGGLRGFSKVLHDITERTRMEDALLASQARLSGIIASAMDAIIALDHQQRIVLFNTAAEKMFGCPAKQAVGQSIERFIPQRFRERHAEHVSRFGETGVTNRAMGLDNGLLWAVRANGQEFQIEASISQVVTGVNKIFTVIIRDVSERQRAEASRMHLAAIVESTESAILSKDLNGIVTSWNKGAELLYGYRENEMLGKHINLVIPPELQMEQLEFLLQVAEGKVTQRDDTIRRRKDGTLVPVSLIVSPIRDPSGKVVGASTIARDITERKQARDQLVRQAEELTRSRRELEAQTLMLQSVLDSMAEGMVAADEQGKFVIWNPAAEKILGLGASPLPIQDWPEHYGLFLPDTVTPFPPDELPLVRAIRGESSTLEMFVRNPELAEGVWIEANASPLKGKDGVVRGGVVAFRDITKSKMAEREIRELNEELELRVLERTEQLEAANKELEAFTYSVSHDLRAPLRHIGGFSNLLMEEFGTQLPSKAQHYLQRIAQGTRHMGQLVDELLNLARVSRYEVSRKATGLNAIVAEVMAMLEPESEGRQVEWRIADLPAVECDPILTKQVFQNLLANALKFTRPRAHAVIEIDYRQEKGQPVIFVRDNGVGFSMKYVDKLFGVFQRLHSTEDFEGTGVGLATVQRIVYKHGGRVWAEAAPEQGATFYFTLGNGVRETAALPSSALARGAQA